MKFRERRRHCRRRSNAGEVIAGLLGMIKFQLLTVTIWVTLRGVGVAAMYAPAQIPGGGGLFIYK